MIGRGQVEAQHPEDRPQKALRLTKGQVKDQAERQRGFDGNLGVLQLPSALADAHGLPRGDRFRRQPQGDVASLDQCSVVRRPVSDAVFRFVPGMHSRLHVEIMPLRPSRWPGPRRTLVSAHQRPDASSLLHRARSWRCRTWAACTTATIVTRPDDRHGRSPPEDRARRAAAGGTSEGRQPLVDVHGVHGRDAHVAIVRRPHVRAIGHANRAYEVFRRYRGWIVLGTIILISEIIVSTDFYLVFFAASAVIVGLLVLLGVSLPVSAQWLLFAALSIGMLVLFRARLREKIKTREQDVDKLEDEIAVATEQLAAGGTGQAELRGSTWRARNIGELDLEVGDRCRVERVDGLVLSIRKDL